MSSRREPVVHPIAVVLHRAAADVLSGGGMAPRQDAVAAAFGVPKQAWNDYLHGRKEPKVETLVSWLEAWNSGRESAAERFAIEWTPADGWVVFTPKGRK